MGDADLEIGLQWDRRRQEFFVSNRFEIIGENVDDWAPSDKRLSIDVQKLGHLTADEAAYGTALTEMLLRPGDIGPFYEHARARTQGGDHRLHMRLHISGRAPARYHAIRWESLRDPTTGTPIAMQSNVLLSRYLSSPDWRPVPAPDKHDLRALIVIAGPRDLQSYRPNGRELGVVNVEEELKRARTALTAGVREVRMLTSAATLPNIMEALEDGVDVLYLICHGALIDDVPLLYLETPERAVDVVDGHRLVEGLSELDRRPMVVMLCSCQSASAGTEMWSTDDGELSALGPQLAKAGIGAVVAMQGNISMTTAQTFAPAFFTALAQHGIVDQAMATARRAIRQQPDWWVPVLYSRLRSGRTYYTSGFAHHEEDTWQSLVTQVKLNYFTPVIGPLLTSQMIGSRQDIARDWVRRWQMQIAPHNQGDLAQVAQHLRVRTNPGLVRTQLRVQLMNTIREHQKNALSVNPNDPVWNLPDPGVLLRDNDPESAIRAIGQRQRIVDDGDPYNILAELETPVYVTTGWTDLLQDALAEHGRQPITMWFPWNKQAAMKQTGRRDSPTVQRPLVYHLYGRLDNLESLVLSEDDYFVWLNAWANRGTNVPSLVYKALTARPLLFLGYRLDEWDFRVVFHSIKNLGGSTAMGENQHVAVQLSRESQSIEPEAVQQYLESYFGEAKISIYWGSTRQFLLDLRDRIRL